MPQRVLLQLASDGQHRWLDLDRPQSGLHAGLPAAGSECTVLAPAEDVLLSRAPRVARSDRLLRQALPFAIEERLAAPVEQLHIAFAGAGDPLEIAVVERARLQDWLAIAANAGLELRALCSEASLLPQPGAPMLVVDGERVLLRSASGSVVVDSLGGLPDLLDLLAGTQEPIDGWRVLVCAGSRREQLPPALAMRAEAAPALAVLLAAQLKAPVGPDLLQGEFARRQAGDALPWLKRAAVLAAVAVGLSFTHALVERQQLQGRIEAQRAEMAELLRQAVPGTSVVVDPRAQLEIEFNRLQRGAGGDDALGLLARIAPSLAGSSRYTLEAVDYRSGAIDLTLRAPDVATLDGLRETFVALGLAAELTAATPGQGGVEGRVSVRAGGGA
jgi:general secretion pathway protein L